MHLRYHTVSKVVRTAHELSVMMGHMATLDDLTDAGRAFLTGRDLATLATMGPSGLIHAVAVGFTVHDGLVRVITFEGSQKVLNIERDPRATVSQIVSPQWLSIAGPARILREPDDVRLAEDLYAQRYRQPRPNPQRVVIEIVPEKVLMSPGLRGEGPAHG